MPVEVRVQTLKILNYSKDLDLLTDEARRQQSMNVQLLSLSQRKSQVLVEVRVPGQQDKEEYALKT